MMIGSFNIDIRQHSPEPDTPDKFCDLFEQINIKSYTVIV